MKFRPLGREQPAAFELAKPYSSELADPHGPSLVPQSRVSIEVVQMLKSRGFGGAPLLGPKMCPVENQIV